MTATFRLLATTVGVLLSSLSGSIAAQDFPVTQVSDGVYVIYGPISLATPENRGFRNNPAVVLTMAGAVVIDPGGSVVAGEIVLAKLRSITDKPVVAIFNTHIHGDHWLGNAALKAAYPNVTIYGHEKMKVLAEGPEGKRLMKTVDQVTKGANSKAKPVAPNKTVKDGEVIQIGDVRFRIFHADKAHTDGDIMIEAVDKDVLFTGDVVRERMVGQMSGGSFAGNIKAIDRALATKMKVFVPGHGQAGGVEMVKTYRGYLSTLYGTVEKLYAAGIADFEMKPKVVAALGPYKDWWGFDDLVGPQISQAYLEVESRAF